MSGCPGEFDINKNCSLIDHSAINWTWAWQEDDGTPIDMTTVSDIQFVVNWENGAQSIWSITSGRIVWIDQAQGQWRLNLRTEDLVTVDDKPGEYAMWIVYGADKSVIQEGAIRIRKVPNADQLPTVTI